MKHFSIKQVSIALLLVAISSTPLHASKKKHHKGNDCSVKFVKGGAPDGGNGSRKKPYNNLPQAQADDTWDKLVVLPSSVALDFGITLRPGTKLIGELPGHPWPTVDCEFPIITNETGDNGGNGVVVKGDATIENIHFKDSEASAIQYNKARDLTVKNILITGHNQGNVEFNDFLGRTIRVGGIFGGELTTDGTTCLQNVVIRDNKSGDGIIEYALAGSKRTFIAQDCDLSCLKTNVNLDDPNEEALPFINGITLIAGEEGTKHCNEVKCCIIHDFLRNDFDSITAAGVRIESQANGQSCSTIERSTFQNLHTMGNTQTFHLYHESGGTIPTLKQTITIEQCLFEENQLLPVNAVVNVTNNGCVQSNVLDSTIVNVSVGILTSLFSGTHEDIIVGNCVSIIGSFYIVNNFKELNVQTAYIAGNNVTGFVLAAIGVFPMTSPWEKLFIKVRDNCFDGGRGFGFLGQGLTSAGDNAIIDAGTSPQDPGKNNITLQIGGIDIIDLFTNTNYLAQGNWWGGDAPTVLNLGTGDVDVLNPLTAPVKCPLTCTCDHETPRVPNDTSIERKLPTEEEIEQLKAQYLTLFNSCDHETPRVPNDTSTERKLPTKKEIEQLKARYLELLKLK